MATNYMSPPNLNRYLKVIFIISAATHGLSYAYHESFKYPVIGPVGWYVIVMLMCAFGFWVLHRNYRL